MSSPLCVAKLKAGQVDGLTAMSDEGVPWPLEKPMVSFILFG